MFEFQVDGPLSSRENDLLDGLATRDLIDLGDVLLECLEDAQETISVYAPDERICPRRPDPARDGGHAIRECGLRGKSGTSRRLEGRLAFARTKKRELTGLFPEALLDTVRFPFTIIIHSQMDVHERGNGLKSREIMDGRGSGKNPVPVCGQSGDQRKLWGVLQVSVLVDDFPCPMEDLEGGSP